MAAFGSSGPSNGRPSRNALLALLLPGLVLAACWGGGGSEPTDTPTAGRIVIAADQSFQPLIQAEIDVFEGLYRRAEIEPRWLPEDEAIQALLLDSVRLVVVSRALTPEETGAFEQLQLRPRTLKLAEDGVALILNRRNPDTTATMTELRGVFTGTKRTWADLGPGGLSGEIVIVFDNNNSSNLNYILRKFEVESLDSLRVFAAQSNEEVITYVQEHENAMGVIGTNWISDSDDPSQQRFLSSIAVMAIAAADSPTEDDYYQPYQAYLSLKQYPLARDVTIISREARAGLGSGFMSFVASDRGQRIVLKSGLLPATMPVRLVSIRDDSL